MLFETSDSGWPFPPPERTDLRCTVFRQVGEMVERWIWEPNATAWAFQSARTRTEMDAGVAEILAARRPLTEAEQAHARKLAEELGL